MPRELEITRAMKDFLLDCVFPGIYEREIRLPVEEGRCAFVSLRGHEMPDSFRLLYDRLKRQGSRFDVHLHFLCENEVSHFEYVRRCADMLKSIARAQYVFLEDASNVISCINVRPETRVVQLWHACGAFKKWGMSTADLQFGGDRSRLKRHPFYRNLSLVTVSSPEVEWAYTEAMDLWDTPSVVRALGVSRTDVFFDDEFIESSRKRVHGAIPQCSGKRIIVYAPTFRGRTRHATGPDALDYRLMMRELGDKYVLLVKHHPFVSDRPAIPVEVSDFAFDVSDTLDIEDLICSADVCISDYSSLVFEYSLFEKPMLFFAFDKDDYADWRGFYYDYEAFAPGPIVSNTEDLVLCVRDFENGFDGEDVRAFKNKFMSACDGHATDRICEEVFGEVFS